MRPALRVGVWVLCGVCACAPAPRLTTARVTLRTLPGCELGSKPKLRLRAAGDFPAPAARAFSSAAPVTFDGLPQATRWLVLEATDGRGRAGGLVALPGRDLDRGALMLPLGRSCPLGDPLAAAPAGAAVAALPDGDLLIAGGQNSSGEATADAVVLPAGEPLVTEVAGGMLLHRAGASATRVGSLVLIAGGGPDARSTAHDTFEVFDSETRHFDTAQSAKLAGGPRREHGAVLLPDGRVLIAGGQAAVGSAPLGSAELIDVATSRVERVAGELQVARIAPQLLVLDGGAVLVALGRDASGALVSELESFDLGTQRFSLLAAQLPVHAEAAVAALEGDRVAYLGCDPGDAGCELVLIVPDGHDFGVVTPFDRQLLSASGLRDLEQVRLLALRDGRLLVTGRDRSQLVERRAFVIDLNASTIEPLESTEAISRVPDDLLALDDGTLVELNAAGLSLGRRELVTELDSPPAGLIGADVLGVALDHAARWGRSGDALTALQAARFDLPFLRFADVRVELELEGEASLLLEPESAMPIALSLSPPELALGACKLARRSGDAIAVERHAATVVLHSGARSQSCDAPRLRARIGIAVQAQAGARVAKLHVRRL
jgi:hypothetical protein